MAGAEPPPLTRAGSKYLELIGELPPNTFLKQKSMRSMRKLEGVGESKADAGESEPESKAEPVAGDEGAAAATLGAIIKADGDDDEVDRWAAKQISSVFMIALAKRRAAKKAAKLYQRFWEPHWAAEYYYNPLTKQSFWERPKPLLDEEVPFSDEGSAAMAAEHEAAKAAVPSPKNWRERIAKMKEKNPKGGHGRS